MADTPLKGLTFTFAGEFSVWPRHHGASPEGLAKRLGARVVSNLSSAVDRLVLGDLKAKGRAETKKRGEQLAAAKNSRLQILDEAAFRELVRIDLKKKKFQFIGGFDCSPGEATDGVLAGMVKNVGGKVVSELDESVDYLVVGNRRGDKKIATLNAMKRLNDDGADIVELDESAFLELVRVDAPKKKSKSKAKATESAAAGTAPVGEFANFVSQLYGYVDQGKLGRALDMLQHDKFKLYLRLDEAQLVGVTRSQSGSGSVYASWLAADGRYGCAQPDLSDCMGLQGAPCKHLLVLLVGAARTSQLPQATALEWIKAARGKGPKKNTELCGQTLIAYKGAEAGEIDWRPTETIPEDFYAG